MDYWYTITSNLQPMGYYQSFEMQSIKKLTFEHLARQGKLFRRTG
jgi:hypothetical protein